MDKGYDPKHGARPLRRAIQEHFEDRLADQLLIEKQKTNLLISATVKKGEIVFKVTPQEEPKPSETPHVIKSV